jgi:hypothetical protein
MQVGKISSYNLEKNFSEFYSEMTGTTGSGFINYAPRIIHNQEQVVRCQLRDDTATPNGVIKYWNMDGTEAAQFTIGSGGVPYTNILDIAWINDESKFVYVTADSSLVTGDTYNIYKCDVDGSVPELLISAFDADGEWAAWSTASVSGYVGICASDTDIFLKTGTNLYKIPEGLSGAWSSISSDCTLLTNGFHYGDGIGCNNLMYQPAASGITASGYVLYTWYDSDIDTLYLRTIQTENSMAYDPDRWAMLNITDYGDAHEPVFLNQLDTDALHVFLSTNVTTSGQVSETPAYFNVFNIDETLAAFLNVNSSDTVMPAGIGAQSDIIATVVNCWGTTLSGKLVQFWVSSGDGGVNPSYDYTGADGKAETVFTTGANVGISNVAVVVNEI